MNSQDRKIEPTGQMDLDICQAPWIVKKVQSSDIYARKLYAAMCNIRWQHQEVFSILKNQYWTVSWRSAGGIIADIRGEGDYMNWYCSGNEGYVDPEIEQDMAAIGWQWSEWPDETLS
jgi:hypothetical protein